MVDLVLQNMVHDRLLVVGATLHDQFFGIRHRVRRGVRLLIVQAGCTAKRRMSLPIELLEGEKLLLVFRQMARDRELVVLLRRRDQWRVDSSD